MSAQLQVTGEAKIRDIQGPVVANDGVVTALDGAASQYVRGDGTLADFPTSSGGGSSVSYYLNSSVSQGTIGGVAYRELSKDPIIGAGTDIAISSNGYVANYITDVNDPDVVLVPGGNFNCEFYFSVNNNSGNPFTYAELYKYDGTTFTLLGSSVGVPEYINQGTIIAPYYFAIPVPTSALALTDRLAIRIYVNVDGRTVTLHTENGHLCQVVTTLSKGMVSLNNLTDQSQFLTTGTSGTNFAIVSSGDTHTFNLPVASASNTGKLSSTDWSTFNNKQNALTNPITGTGASGNVAYFDGVSSITSENSFNYDASTNRLGVNTTVPNATIGANAGTDSGYSLLVKNDNANYNGIGFATTSTYGNVIGTEKLGTAPARNLTLLNQSGYISITEVGNLGVNILNPNTGLDIYNGTSAYLWLHTANSGITGTDGVRLALFSNNGANLRNFEGAMSITSEGDFQVITLGAENIRVNSTDGKVGIGNPTTVAEMLTVNGSIQQSGVLSSLLKTNGDGKLIAAVAGTDYVVPSALSGYVPTSRTLSINGTTYDLSANRSWTITSDITGSGADGRVAYWNGTNSLTSEAGFIYDASTNRLGVNTSVPNATIGADAALNSGYGLLIKTGASDYNGIGIAIDSTYGNTIEAARLGTAPSRNLTLLNVSGYVSLTETGNFGVGILTPNNGIDIYNSTQSQLWLHNAASGITGTDGVRLALFNNLSANLRNFDGALSLTAEGDFSIITIGTENFKVNSANGFVAIGGPATITSMLTVNGAITQSSVTSALLKTNASGTLVAAVAGTDYQAPITNAITGTGTSNYVPKFTGTSTLGNSNIQDSGTLITLGVLTNYTYSDNNFAGFNIRNTNTNSFALSGIAIQNSGGTTVAQINYVSTVYANATVRDTFLLNTVAAQKLAFATNSGGGGTRADMYFTVNPAFALSSSNPNQIHILGTSRNVVVNYSGTDSGHNFQVNGSSNFIGDGTFTNVAPIFAIKSSTTGNVSLRFMQTVDTVATMFYQTSSTSLNIANNVGELRFSTGAVSSALVIANAGAATFSSDLTTGGKILINDGGNSTIPCLKIGSATTGISQNVSEQLNFITNSSTKMIITSGGNVLIGTTSNASGSPTFYVQNKNGAVANIGGWNFGGTSTADNANNNLLISGAYYNGSSLVATQSTATNYQQYNGEHIFYTNAGLTAGNAFSNTERMRITSGGNVLIGTSTNASSKLRVSAATDWSSEFVNNHAAGQQLFTLFTYGSTGLGSIQGNGSIVSYYSTSDYRLKEDLQDFDALSKISLIKVYDYKWKNTGQRMDGFMAHELQEVLPYAVSGQKDGKEMQNVDYSKLTPVNTKAIQELYQIIKELEARIKQLENK